MATVPARAVSIAAAGGAKKAAKGIRVGSDPVTITGRVMARMVAIAQIPRVTTDSPIQMGRHRLRPRSRPIAHNKTRVPTPPQNHVANAATGRCSCCEPETRSGAKRLISRTATQIPPIPIAVHSIQDRSAVGVWRSSGVGWSFGSGVVMVTQAAHGHDRWRAASAVPPGLLGPSPQPAVKGHDVLSEAALHLLEPAGRAVQAPGVVGLHPRRPPQPAFQGEVEPVRPGRPLPPGAGSPI